MTSAQNSSQSALAILGDILAVAGSLLNRQKNRGMTKMHNLSEASREFVSSLPEMSDLRSKASATAEGVENAADYAMHTDIEHALSDAATFARKHPLATLGLTLAAGLIVSRIFLPADASTATRPASKPVKKMAKPATKPRRKVNGTARANGS